MNKKFKKSSVNTYSEEKEKKSESKSRIKKDSTKTNQRFNKVLKDIDINDLDSFEEFEYELFEQKAKGKK